MDIHDAARSGNISDLAKELDAGDDINCLELTTGMSALEIACRYTNSNAHRPSPNASVVQFLVELGASITDGRWLGGRGGNP